MTIVSQPVLGATCFTPSRSLSRNTSISQNGNYGTCTGQSPGTYMAQSDPNNQHGGSYSWPIPPSTPFHPTFSGRHFYITYQSNGQTVTRSLTMLEVLNNTNNLDSQQVAFHLIAAYLNCLNNWVSPLALTTAGVQAIWTEWDTQGYYEPMAGVRWYAAEIKNYLISNGIVA
jgi:hypothetical protein